MRPRPTSVLFWATVCVSGLVSGPLAAQQGCEAIAPGNDLTRALTVGGMQITYITNPHFLCAGGVEIWADSAEAFPDRGYSHLIGNVRYEESTRELRADDARYFTNEGRLQAEGKLTLVDREQGSSIENGSLVYLLQTAFRDVAEMTVVTGADGVRPVAVLTPPPPAADTTEFERPPPPDPVVIQYVEVAPDSMAPDSIAQDSITQESVTVEVVDVEQAEPSEAAPGEEPSPGPPPEPKSYTVVGDRIFLLGTGYFTASGDVEIEQDSLRAFADSAEYDTDASGLVLDGDARVLSAEYDLIGRSITMSAPGASTSQIHARREAKLEGEDLLLTSAQIFLFLQDDALERLVATPMVGPAAINADSVEHERPEATVQDFVLTADSLEVRAPARTVERVFASGSARSVSQAGDSLTVDLLPEVAQSDWLEGDTVIVTFAAPARVPSALGEAPEGGRLEVEDIVAIGRARSLYRLASSDSLAQPGVDPPAVHYVVGSEIRIEMNGRQIKGMQVTGQTQGVHMEPLQRRPPLDTIQIDSTLVSDTLAVIDTARAVVDTFGARVSHEDRELGAGDRVRLSSPSPSQPSPGSPMRLRMENQPWNRPWMQ